ncbi:RING/U-box superfamily protein [Arabidopsis thaliana]|uniref:RING/U-box superfamily protein n=1 Tax=Arabidopsis thaliana TaxID=3702 RepID=UPI00017393DC|nr:RING/U-box superfamily protein [Arabidopsis thaliana]AEE83676.1 RING/U-box superfamily protein [Arabidopsis thaliana]|eukprot:NP_567480.2 RING/U-box superfamily protein [Arabidopsis thaliana]
MLTTTILILLIVILMVSLHLYYRWYLLRSSPFNRTTAASTFFTDPSSTPGGLNPSIIKSLPIFTFSAVTALFAMECSVCLSEFKDNESGRVMPNCKHTFHVDCIDMWFHSHSSCPLCRSLIEPFAGGVKSTMDEVAISISDPVYGDTNHHEGTETTGDSVPEDSQRKPAAIEISQRNLGEIENDLSRSHSFRSPTDEPDDIFHSEFESRSGEVLLLLLLLSEFRIFCFRRSVACK